MLFFSPTAASTGSFVPSHSVSGAAGSTGVATLRVTLGNFTDYVAQWTIVGKGAIAIDDIRIEDERHRVTVASEDTEGQSPRIRSARAFLPVVRLGQPVDIALPAVGGRAPYLWGGARCHRQLGFKSSPIPACRDGRRPLELSCSTRW